MSKYEEVDKRLTELVDQSEDQDVKILFALMSEASTDCDWFFPYLGEENWLNDD